MQQTKPVSLNNRLLNMNTAPPATAIMCLLEKKKRQRDKNSATSPCFIQATKKLLDKKVNQNTEAPVY